MACYNNRYGGCFLPSNTVTLIDGTEKRCDEIRKGDIVKTGLTKKSAKVLCAVKIFGSNMMVVKFNESGLGITPWHPMLFNGEWVFPCEHAEAEQNAKNEECKCVYNFVLEKDEDDDVDHTLLVNNIPVVAFGHGLETNSTVSHPYWGNMAFIKRDLSVMRGWTNGFIEVRCETLCVKDKESGLVVKMIQQEEVVAKSKWESLVEKYSDNIQSMKLCEIKENIDIANNKRSSVPTPVVVQSAPICRLFVEKQRNIQVTKLVADEENFGVYNLKTVIV